MPNEKEKEINKVVNEVMDENAKTHKPFYASDVKPEMERSTGRKCEVCGGDIFETFKMEYDPGTGPPVIGPGSRQQFHRVSKGFYCKKCGIKYAF